MLLLAVADMATPSHPQLASCVTVTLLAKLHVLLVDVPLFAVYVYTPGSVTVGDCSALVYPFGHAHDQDVILDVLFIFKVVSVSPHAIMRSFHDGISRLGAT